MDREEFLKLVPARQFFTQYCPGVKRYYHKLRGVDGNKMPLDFSADDKEAIKAGLKKLAQDLKGVKF